MIATAAHPNRLKAALWEGRPQRGLFSGTPRRSGFSETGFDCLICEAGEVFDPSGFAAAGFDTCEIAVCADRRARLVLRNLLRKGIQNIVLTGIAGPSDARDALTALHGRSGFCRPWRGDQSAREESDTQAAEAEICTLALVDGLTDIETLAAIARIRGLSGLILDPARIQPEFSWAWLSALALRIRSAGKAPGIVIAHDGEPEAYFESGFLFVVRREGYPRRPV